MYMDTASSHFSIAHSKYILYPISAILYYIFYVAVHAFTYIILAISKSSVSAHVMEV